MYFYFFAKRLAIANEKGALQEYVEEIEAFIRRRQDVLGYPDAKASLADGRIPCAVAVMRKRIHEGI